MDIAWTALNKIMDVCTCHQAKYEPNKLFILTSEKKKPWTFVKLKSKTLIILT